MSIRNASSSIYYGYIDAQKWSLVSINSAKVAKIKVDAVEAVEEGAGPKRR